MKTGKFEYVHCSESNSLYARLFFGVFMHVSVCIFVYVLSEHVYVDWIMRTLCA